MVNNRIELERTGRDMENLKQWASITQGGAYTEEDCQDIAPLVSAIKKQIQLAEKSNTQRLPLGLNGWALALLLGCLGGEWLL